MVTFLLSLSALVIGYWVYGTLVEKIFGIDEKIATPAIRMADGVDYVAMPTWKIFMIQFLNIAGLGPIFGAILGALFGPVAFLWIVLGCILAGGVHDYLSGMLSVRHDGASIAEVVGVYLGNGCKQFMRIFSIVLLLLVGVVFVIGPAKILQGLTGKDVAMWLYVIFAYYFIATLFPIDQIIGRIYPFFGAVLLFMGLGLLGSMLWQNAAIPELTGTTFTNMHAGSATIFIYPMLFITIACGALSGFHSTQSPMMARCITSERQGRRVFYGAMIAEGVLALIWAAAAMSYFGGVGKLNSEMALHGNNPAWLVNTICNSWLGQVGSTLAILGVVVCPITSGDTAFRSARLTIADMLGLSQKVIKNRLWICVPLFAVGYVVSLVKFDVVWRYFAWSNQTLATIVLWAGAVFLQQKGKQYWIALLPAVVMTAVCTTYILVAPEGFRLTTTIAYPAGIAVSAVCTLLFLLLKRK